MDHTKYFTRKKDTVIFTGKRLEIFIPLRYKTHGCLEVGEVVKALAVFDMTIDGKPSGYLLPAKITIEPTDIEDVFVDGQKYQKLTLYSGDVFIKNTIIVSDNHLAYVVFYEMIYGGNMPKFIGYNELPFVFDTVSAITGISFPTDHVVFEMMSSVLHRDPNDLNVLYRHTDMMKPPRNIPLRLVSHASLSTTSKIVGAYAGDGMDNALVNASDHHSEIEDLLRA